MKAIVRALALAISLLTARPAAADQVTQVFEAPLERVWAATRTALDDQDWGIDDSDRALGTIVTKTHLLQGGEGAWIVGKELRLRLRVSVVPLSAAQVRVSVEREMLRRERVLWTAKDEPVHVTTVDATYERALLRAVAARLGG